MAQAERHDGEDVQRHDRLADCFDRTSKTHVQGDELLEALASPVWPSGENSPLFKQGILVTDVEVIDFDPRGSAIQTDRPYDRPPVADLPVPLRVRTLDGTVIANSSGALPSSDSPVVEDVFLNLNMVHALLDEADREWNPFDIETADAAQGDRGFVTESGLVTLADGTRVFYGTDETAKRSSRLFGYVLEPNDPVPLPETAREGLDLLKPAPVVKALDDPAVAGEQVSRQGDIWLVNVDFVPREPEGSWNKPGVGSRPFGASPLGNHVPREYAFMVSDDEFVSRARDTFDFPQGIAPETPKDVVDVVWKHQRLTDHGDIDSEWTPDMDDLLEIGNGLAVRGTLRHRNNDHFMETIGDGDTVWRAYTQGVDFPIYTADELNGVRARLRAD